MTEAVTSCECSARDGLQYGPCFIPTGTRVALLDAFSAAGCPRIEATSRSHPAQVPAFRDATEVLAAIERDLAKGTGREGLQRFAAKP